MCCPKGYVFLRRFGLKTGIHFAHFRLESGRVFEGTTGVLERICRFSLISDEYWERKSYVQRGFKAISYLAF